MLLYTLCVILFVYYCCYISRWILHARHAYIFLFSLCFCFLAKINVRELISRSTLIVKKELLYLFPFGQLSWLMGVEFVDRSNPTRASKTLSHCERLLTDKSIKIWVYPEGTRSYGKGIQQFKRGAFKIAIQAQAPVVPVVISPYHFLDYKQKQMNKGNNK